jgi:hypothetical protein
MSTFDPMRTFNARTAYEGDFRFVPGIIAATHARDGDADTYRVWLQEINRTHPDYPGAAESLGIQSTDELWMLWKDDRDNPDVAPGDRLTLDDRPAPPIKIVRNTAKAHYSNWMVRTTEGVSDG